MTFCEKKLVTVTLTCHHKDGGVITNYFGDMTFCDDMVITFDTLHFDIKCCIANCYSGNNMKK